jgi:hypothetical protein
VNRAKVDFDALQADNEALQHDSQALRAAFERMTSGLERKTVEHEERIAELRRLLQNSFAGLARSLRVQTGRPRDVKGFAGAARLRC